MRLAQIVKDLSRGSTRKDIQAKYKDKWDVSTSMVDKYLSQAWKEIEKLADYDKQRAFGKAVADLYELYRRAVESDQISVALSVRKELSELLGIKRHSDKTGDLHIHLDKLPDEIQTMLNGVDERGNKELELETKPD